MLPNKLNRQALVLTILTLITVVIWLSVSIYLAATKSTLSSLTAEQLAPLDPRLATETVTTLSNSYVQE